MKIQAALINCSLAESEFTWTDKKLTRQLVFGLDKWENYVVGITRSRFGGIEKNYSIINTTKWQQKCLTARSLFVICYGYIGDF